VSCPLDTASCMQLPLQECSSLLYIFEFVLFNPFFFDIYCSNCYPVLAPAFHAIQSSL
jgi:hypothetical protein